MLGWEGTTMLLAAVLEERLPAIIDEDRTRYQVDPADLPIPEIFPYGRYDMTSEDYPLIVVTPGQTPERLTNERNMTPIPGNTRFRFTRAMEILVVASGGQNLEPTKRVRDRLMLAVARALLTRPALSKGRPEVADDVATLDTTAWVEDDTAEGPGVGDTFLAGGSIRCNILTEETFERPATVTATAVGVDAQLGTVQVNPGA